MAASFEEAQAQIRSLQPGQLRGKAGELREFGIDTRLAGSELGASADTVGSQRGAPYAAYHERLTPTANWLRSVEAPAVDTAAGLENAGGAAERAQMVLAQQEQLLAAMASSAQPGTFEQAKAAALTKLNEAIAEVSSAYGAIAPPPPAAAPVVVSGSGGTGSAVAAAGAGTAGTLAGLAAGGRAADSGAQAELGPQSGPFAGFIQDPTSGNLIDPGTGREVDAGGRFLDPVTGLPFGGPGQFASRLEGLVGGVPAGAGVLPLGLGGAGVPPGVLGVGGPGAVGVGLTPAGVPGGFGAAGGVVPFLPPGVVGGVGPAGARGGGTDRFARIYGGVVPPSLSGSNPAGEQLQRIAAQNLEQKAAVAQRYAAIATGQPTSGFGFFPPPMMGVGGGGTGAARSTRRSGSTRAVTESAGVWGAAGAGGGRRDRRNSRPAAETEDHDVWTGGNPVSGLLEGR